MLRSLAHPIRALLLATALWLPMLGCDDGSTASPRGADAASDAGVTQPDAAEEPADTTTVEVDDSDKAFASDVLLKVVIEMPDSDWNFIRQQVRDMSNFLAPGCLSKPFDKPYLYRKATVTINGVQLGDVGVRKKGFVGSNDIDKPSLKLRLDKFVDGQELMSLNRLTLNNNRQDPAHVSQCLTYDIFRRAGVPAPRCNFAHVWVNGVDLGVYTHVESVKKRFLKRHFASEDGPLLEGTISDFSDEMKGTFEPKHKGSEKGLAAIDAVIEALATDDATAWDALAKLVDLPAYVRFWAVESLVRHRDGYAGNRNNFYLYQEPKTGLLHFLPWGVDNTVRNPGPNDSAAQKLPRSVLANSALSRRLWDLPKGRALYVESLQEVLKDAFDETYLLGEVDRMQALISAAASAHQFPHTAKYPLTAALNGTRAFIKGRRAEIEPELKSPPGWPLPPPGKLCFEVNTEISASVEGKYGTLQAQNAFAVGNGELNGVTEDGPFGPLKVGVKAGSHPEQAGLVKLEVIFQRPDNPKVYVVLVLHVAKSDFKAGHTAPLRALFKGPASALVFFDTDVKKPQLVGLLWEGSLQLEAAKLQVGAPFKATLKTRWVPWGNPGG